LIQVTSSSFSGTKSLVAITQKVGNSRNAEAVERSKQAPSIRFTGIIGARVIIKAGNISVNTSSGNIAGVIGAVVEVIAFNGQVVWNVVASRNLTDIVGAGIVVVTESVFTLSV
jgi:hypothetical protein